MFARRGAPFLWALLGVVLLLGAFYFDAAVHSWMQEHQAPAVTAVMEGASRWGDWPPHVAVGFIAAVLAYFAGSRQWLAIFLALVLACAVAGTVNRAIKIAAGRARPSVTMDPGWHGLKFSSKYTAFPSGHTAATAAFFGTLIFARRRIGLALLPIPLLIATSRVYLGAHHLSDVMGGAIVGTISGFLVWRFVHRRWSQGAAGKLAAT
jgi:undecaprenyl-diphosphatase